MDPCAIDASGELEVAFAAAAEGDARLPAPMEVGPGPAARTVHRRHEPITNQPDRSSIFSAVLYHLLGYRYIYYSPLLFFVKGYFFLEKWEPSR
jgi:hypothetical protein